MTAAAISATFSDFRLVKGRKVAQLVLEVPIEQANSALAALGGIPQPMSETWVAVARLNAGAADANAASSHSGPVVLPGTGAPSSPQAGAPGARWHEIPASKQAGILSKDKAFQAWAAQCAEEHEVSEAVAAQYIRDVCGVNSRAWLDEGQGARKRWDALVSEFRQATGQMAEQRGALTSARDGRG